jgi:hypothetical protein
LDGTKIKANASKHKAMSYGRMKQREAELAAEVQKWLEQAEAADAADDEALGRERRGDELPEWVHSKQQRLAKMREAMAALEAAAAAEAQAAASAQEPCEPPADGAEGSQEVAPTSEESPPQPATKAPPDKAQRNFTDPESRIMKTPNGFEQAYNAQAVVDADSQVIVAEGLTNAGNDKQQVVPMAEEIEKNTGRTPKELSADSGYCSEANLEDLEQRGIRGYIATGRQKHGTASATKQGAGRDGTRVQKMSRRLKQGGHRSRYRLRKQTVEPVFGQIKGARGFRQFQLRGLAKVADEWRLIGRVVADPLAAMPAPIEQPMALTASHLSLPTESCCIRN